MESGGEERNRSGRRIIGEQQGIIEAMRTMEYRVKEEKNNGMDLYGHLLTNLGPLLDGHLA